MSKEQQQTFEQMSKLDQERFKKNKINKRIEKLSSKEMVKDEESIDLHSPQTRPLLIDNSYDHIIVKRKSHTLTSAPIIMPSDSGNLT